jgi:ABC-2 type transport system ATP-binding protein
VIPVGVEPQGRDWRFELPESGVETLLKGLVEGGAGIESLSIERPGLHDAFIAIAGEAAADAMNRPTVAEAA